MKGKSVSADIVLSLTTRTPSFARASVRQERYNMKLRGALCSLANCRYLIDSMAVVRRESVNDEEGKDATIRAPTSAATTRDAETSGAIKCQGFRIPPLMTMW